MHLVPGASKPQAGTAPAASTSTGNFFPSQTPNVQDMQQQMMNNPQMMDQMLNNPMMETLMSNPEFMRNIIQMNPGLRRVIENNPELAQVFNDPSTLRDMMATMRDPNRRAQMMRDTDRAISNISNHPEGFAALRRMYTNIQEPMLEAEDENPLFQGADDSNPTNPSEPLPDTSQPNSNPLPNPWAPSNPQPNLNPFAMFGRPPQASQPFPGTLFSPLLLKLLPFLCPPLQHSPQTPLEHTSLCVLFLGCSLFGSRKKRRAKKKIN